MESSVQDPLARFHRALVEEILRTRPLYLSEPFTVSEIYQNLVPYRTHRDRIGVAMNGDYEDVLLRLLAGEGQYLVLESEHARREIEQELTAQSPNTGLYREYAAVDVRLNPLRMPRDLPDPGSPGEPGEQGAQGTALGMTAPSSFSPFPQPSPSQPASSQPAPSQPATSQPASSQPAAASARPAHVPTPSVPSPPSEAAPVEPAGDAPETPSNCLWCREPLPRRDLLNYCPFCGADLHKAPCPNCGEELEVGWRFCVACGTGVDDRA